MGMCLLHCLISAFCDSNVSLKLVISQNHIAIKAKKFLIYSMLSVWQEMYLPHMIRSMLKQLQLGETDQTLLSFIDKAMRVEERKKLLESHYSQELSLLYVLQEDYDRAKYYTNYAIELFMEVFCSTAFLLLPLLFQSGGGSH